MIKVTILCDYKDRFGLKWNAKPYRSGFDKELLEIYFRKYDIEVEFIQFIDIDLTHQNWKKKIVIYTSSEEVGDNYKQFIEDIVYGLEIIGAIVIPSYKFLRAHNNKVFMEILREIYFDKSNMNFFSRSFGTYEELINSLKKNEITYPCVIKKASGAMSRGVRLAINKPELMKLAKLFSRTNYFIHETKEYFRAFKIPGYSRESRYQNKFLIQPFVKDLEFDWKVLIFGDQYYVLRRGVRPNDFRASGSHHDYKSGSQADIPIIVLDYLEYFYEKLDLPFISLDVGYDGCNIFIFEFQCIYFGTSTQYISSEYFTKIDNKWVILKKQFDQEETFVLGLVHYLRRNNFYNN